MCIGLTDWFFECGATLLKPQRLINLSPSEEEHRLIQTWKDFDHRMFNVCFGSLSWLEEQVLEPQVFRDNTKATVVSFSDQVPFWVKVKSARQLFASWELSTKTSRCDVSRLSRYRRESQHVEHANLDNDGMSQLRGKCADDSESTALLLSFSKIRIIILIRIMSHVLRRANRC